MFIYGMPRMRDFMNAIWACISGISTIGEEDRESTTAGKHTICLMPHRMRFLSDIVEFRSAIDIIWNGYFKNSDLFLGASF